MSSKVLCVGMCVLDYVVSVDAFPSPDSKQRAVGQCISGGGNAANTAVALARLGECAGVVAKIGQDSAGAQIRSELEDEGVDCTHLVEGHAGECTTTAFVISAVDTRTIISTPSAQRCRDLTAANVSPSMLDEVAVLVLDGRNAEAALSLASAARHRGVPILCEAERGVVDESLLLPLLQHADYVVTNESYPCGVTGEAQIPSALRVLLRDFAPRAKWVVATLGSKGCVALVRTASDATDASGGDGWIELTHDAWPLGKTGRTVVDTTGAGDAFIAGLACSIRRGLHLDESLKLATYVAAMNCCGHGARGGMPSREQARQEFPHLFSPASGASVLHGELCPKRSRTSSEVS